MRFLIIQTAFIGDVILASGIPGKIRRFYPDAQIDFLVRKGNETLLSNNPSVNEVLVWNKKQGKYRNLFRLIRTVRKKRYDYVINLQRFGAMGFLTARSKAKNKIGFDKNPFSAWFTKKVKHEIGDSKHEIERNNALIAELTDDIAAKPELFPTEMDFAKTEQFKEKNYAVIAPASVWFTKQVPEGKWIELLDTNENLLFYLIGSPADKRLADKIKNSSRNSNVVNLCGELSLLESAALIKDAVMTFSNDSAPMHIASAMNAPITAVYCSTVPEFGFGPLSETSFVIETSEKLDCRPCGLHGFSSCPKKHFKCGKTLNLKQRIDV